MVIDEENEILRENFMVALREVKLLYESGEIVLNKNILERLQMHLSKEKVFEAIGKKQYLNTGIGSDEKIPNDLKKLLEAYRA